MILLENFGISAATTIAGIICIRFELPIWSMLLSAVVFSTNSGRVRDGFASVTCLAIGICLSAAGGLALGALAPFIGAAALPSVLFGITFVVLAFQFIPKFNNMLAYYLGLIEFIAAGKPPSAASVGTLLVTALLGSVLAITSAQLQHRIVRASSRSNA